MKASAYFGLALVVAGGIACVSAPSSNMNVFLIPGSIAVLAGAALIIWGSLRFRKPR